MPVIETSLDVHGEEFSQNRKAMLKAVEEFRSIEKKVVAKAETQRPKFEKRGQWLPACLIQVRRF